MYRRWEREIERHCERILKSYAFNDTCECIRKLNECCLFHFLFISFSIAMGECGRRMMIFRLAKRITCILWKYHEIIISVFVCGKMIFFSDDIACLTWCFVAVRFNNGLDMNELNLPFYHSFWQICAVYLHLLLLLFTRFNSFRLISFLWSQFHLKWTGFPRYVISFQVFFPLSLRCLLTWFTWMGKNADQTYRRRKNTHITTANPLQAHSWQLEKKAIFSGGKKEGIKTRTREKEESTTNCEISVTNLIGLFFFH